MDESKEPPKTPPVQPYSAKVHHKYKNPGRSAFAQVLATVMQNLLLIEIGLDMTMPTIILGSLYRSPAEPLNMNDDQASWFGSIPNFCHPLASLLSGFFQEKFGRRGAMTIVNIPIFIAWMILYSAQSIYSLYAVVMIMGLCTGLSEASLHSYIGEIGEPHMRGTLSTISTSCALIGVFTMNLLGYLFDWRTVALLSSSCSIITFVVMTQLPESPTWLIMRGRLDEARKSLCWLRGWVSLEEVDEEFQALVKYAGKKSEQSKEGSTKSNLVEDGGLRIEDESFLKRELKGIMSKKVLRPLRKVFIMFVIASIAIVEGMRAFLISELNRLGSPISPKLVLIILSGLFFVGTMVNVMVLRRFGKRRLALFSYSLTAACVFGIGACDSFQLNRMQNALLLWIPIILWMLISFLSGLSVVVLSWQFVSEIFPPVGRGTATGIAAALAHLLTSIATKSYLYAVAWVGFSGVIYLHGMATILGVVYHYFYLPETEGKTLAQIEAYFTKNYDRKEMISMGKAGKKTGKYNEGFVLAE